jgi:hypothetical protein
MTYKLRGEVIVWSGEQGAWHFLYLDKEASALIRKRYKGPRRGFGGIRVKARLGKTVWETSIFPDSRSGCYLLPLKAAVRRAEGIAQGDRVAFSLAISSNQRTKAI